MAGKFELKTAKNGDFYFSLKAGNGQIIVASEMYKSRESALNGIASVTKNGPEDKRYERKTSTNGKPYFVRKATNGQVIGQSEMYDSEAARDNGIESVKRSVADAKTDDQT